MNGVGEVDGVVDGVHRGEGVGGRSGGGYEAPQSIIVALSSSSENCIPSFNDLSYGWFVCMLVYLFVCLFTCLFVCFLFVSAGLFDHLIPRTDCRFLFLCLMGLCSLDC